MKTKISIILLTNISFITAAAAKLLQLCLILSGPIDGSPQGSSVPGILQARTLQWIAISFSNEWKWKVKVKSLSPVRLFATPWTAAYQAPPSMGFPGKSTGVGCHCLLWWVYHIWLLLCWGIFLLCLLSGGFIYFFFTINGCWILSKAFSLSIEIIKWFFLSIC